MMAAFYFLNTSHPPWHVDGKLASCGKHFDSHTNLRLGSPLFYIHPYFLIIHIRQCVFPLLDRVVSCLHLGAPRRYVTFRCEFWVLYIIYLYVGNFFPWHAMVAWSLLHPFGLITNSGLSYRRTMIYASILKYIRYLCVCRYRSKSAGKTDGL